MAKRIVDAPGLFVRKGDWVRVDGDCAGDYIGVVQSITRGAVVDRFNRLAKNRLRIEVLVDRWVGEGNERLFSIVVASTEVVDILRRA